MDTELYDEAAAILKKLQEKTASVKTLVYSSKYKNVRPLYALVSECNKHRGLVGDILSQIGDRSVVAALASGNPEMAIVLLYEYLLGHKFGRAVSLRKMVQEYKEEITNAVNKVLLKHKAKTLTEIARAINQKASIQIPRYMRVNLIKSSVDEAVDNLVAEGWSYVGEINLDKFSETVKSLDKWQFGLDPLLFDLLVFPIGTDLHDHPLTKSGVLIQQDRASCVPAHVLKPPRGSVVLDCCSAPGNKTSHLASLMNNTGQVIALDRDSKRMATMSRLIETNAATCVQMIVQDFLTVRPDSDDARDIQYILVDPSCSGSGMLGSKNVDSDSNNSVHRVQALKKFQISILKHALRFPAVQRVVYSTCSIHPEENEQVVEEVMTQVSRYFKFQRIFPSWRSSRGLNEYENSCFFLRLSPDVDLTQGFFVACFERIKDKFVQPEAEAAKQSQSLQVDKAEEVQVYANKIKKSQDKKKPATSNDEGYNDENIIADSSSSIKSVSLKVSRKRKQNRHKAEKTDFDLDSQCLTSDNDSVCSSRKHKKQIIKCDSVSKCDYQDDGCVQDNVTEESSNPEKQRKGRTTSQLTFAGDSPTDVTTNLKKKKHKGKLSQKNEEFISSSTKHKSDGSAVLNSETGSQEMSTVTVNDVTEYHSQSATSVKKKRRKEKKKDDEEEDRRKNRRKDKKKEEEGEEGIEGKGSQERSTITVNDVTEYHSQSASSVKKKRRKEKKKEDEDEKESRKSRRKEKKKEEEGEEGIEGKIGRKKRRKGEALKYS